jgi:hypothetical protein
MAVTVYVSPPSKVAVKVPLPDTPTPLYEKLIVLACRLWAKPSTTRTADNRAMQLSDALMNLSPSNLSAYGRDLLPGRPASGVSVAVYECNLLATESMLKTKDFAYCSDTVARFLAVSLQELGENNAICFP